MQINSSWKAVSHETLAAALWHGLVDLPLDNTIVHLTQSSVYVIGYHAVVGLAVLGLAYYDNSIIRKMEVPARLKRIVMSIVTLATAQLVLGILLYLVSFYNLGNLAGGE